MKTITTVITLVLLLCFAPAASAGLVVSNANSGWYNGNGVHEIANPNYIASSNYSVGYRDYFIFNLAGVAGPIGVATFNVYAWSITTDGTFTIRATELPVSINDSSFDPGVFAALGAGTPIGSMALSPGNANSWLAFTLNPAGISWLNAHLGSSVVMGGTFDASAFGYAMGSSDFTPGNNLTLDAGAVPEPASWLALAGGLLGLAAFRSRLRSF